MQQPREPICLAEERRLGELYALKQLVIDPDPILQDIVADAARCCDLPMAAISLISRNSIWFRARHGIDVTKVQRCYSFGTHAIQNDGVFEVTDMSASDIFAANPLVTGMLHVRFFASAPLRTPSGRRMGALSVADRVVREPLDGACKTRLLELADAAMARLYRLAPVAVEEPEDERGDLARLTAKLIAA